jgi:sugar phosphate isomerase/epimerase
MIRLGGPVFADAEGPEEWIAALRPFGYSAASCPIDFDAPPSLICAYRDVAQRNDIVIAEVGAWSNPISADTAVRTKAISDCQRRLDLADRIGALCCVNIAGSCGAGWDHPHPSNDSPETFDLIVESVRQIIDGAKPKRARYTLETMPWIPPDSPDSYLALIKAIDRRQFAVHLDPVNMINCPSRAYHNAGFLQECVRKLGPYIVACHAKDIKLSPQLTVHLDECRPGTGILDYGVYLNELATLPADIPLLLEHLPNAQEYALGAVYIRETATKVGVAIR